MRRALVLVLFVVAAVAGGSVLVACDRDGGTKPDASVAPDARPPDAAIIVSPPDATT